MYQVCKLIFQPTLSVFPSQYGILKWVAREDVALLQGPLNYWPTVEAANTAAPVPVFSKLRSSGKFHYDVARGRREGKEGGCGGGIHGGRFFFFSPFLFS